MIGLKWTYNCGWAAFDVYWKTIWADVELEWYQEQVNGPDPRPNPQYSFQWPIPSGHSGTQLNTG